MAFAPHYRITALGRLASPAAERFSYGFSMHRDGQVVLPGLAPNGDVWADIAEDIRAFHGSDAARLADRAILEEVKVAHIGSDGKYIEDPFIVNVTDTPGGISFSDDPGSAYIPPQNALAVSLRTERRGATGRGRFFLPMPVVGLEPATLAMTASVRDGIEAACKVLLDNVNNAPGIDVLDLEICVASSKGYNTSVTGVVVGRVVDTIRSRRRSLDEAYATITPLAQNSN